MRAAFRQATGLAALALVPAVATALLHPKRPAFTGQTREGEITVAAAMAHSGDYLWIDARTAAHFATQHIPGALPLNEDAWDDLLPAVLQAWPTARPAIVYCDSRECEASEDVAKRLREFGVGPVFVLKGGWQAWQSARVFENDPKRDMAFPTSKRNGGTE